jgi:UDP-glucose 4-epimerase
MKILVCGGAGYIGSHATRALLDKGHTVCVIDNLGNGHRKSVHSDAQFTQLDIRDEQALDKYFKDNRAIDAVMDFAAYSLVGESTERPLKYYENNVGGSISLVKAITRADIGHMVFSSTAAVYGSVQSVPILETDPLSPVNPYGETKLAVENMLKWSSAAYGFNYAALRYFNVAGAHESGEIGEDHFPETHIIPVFLKKAGANEGIQIFGGDYGTLDGTCVRDYIHVTDLVNAHILALDKIMDVKENRVYNLGSGKGFSNMEVLRAVEKAVGRDIQYTIEKRRPGDPDILIASSEKIVNETGWERQYDSLEKIIDTAWNWHKNHPDGYKDKLN